MKLSGERNATEIVGIRDQEQFVEDVRALQQGPHFFSSAGTVVWVGADRGEWRCRDMATCSRGS